MKKITLFLLITFLSYLSSFGQIGVFENFDNGIPADWTSTFFASATQSCLGQSARDNIYSSSATGELISPNYEGQSNETDLTISFDYKIVNYSTYVATPEGWGSFTVDYTTDGGTTWINIDTIDDSNHVVSADCVTKTFTVLAADLPVGSDFQLRFDIAWQAGDYYMYYDNVSMLQVAENPPNCDAVLTTPADGDVDLEIENTIISWSGATGIPTSYNLTVGTTSGGNDVLDNVNVGDVTSYDLENLNYETTYYVTIVPENDLGEATGCTEYSFTTEADPAIIVDCSLEPVTNNFCYDQNSAIFEYIYASSDGSVLNLVVNQGQVENTYDEFIVLDTDGTELYNGYGDAGDLSGLSFQSSGNRITVILESDVITNCSTNGYTPIDYTVSCSACINPAATFTVVGDCANGPQFNVEVDLTSLGDATDVTIEDNQGNSQVESAVGVYTFGPYINGTLVDFTITNNQDASCDITSESLTQEYCETNYIECGSVTDPINTVFCYENSMVTEITYVSTDSSLLNLLVNEGQVENSFDEFIVLDSDGTELYNGYGNAGDLSGLEFQSTGNQITIQVQADVSGSCQSSGYIPIDLTVECSSCANPVATFTVVEDCDNGPQFNVEVDLTSLGDATDVTIADNQGNSEVENALGVYTFGPYTNGTSVEFTITNNQDASCDVVSDNLIQNDCPPDNNFCADAFVANVNSEQFCIDTSIGTISESTASNVPVSCNANVVQDVWYQFTALSTNHMITLIDAPDNVNHAIYEGSCDNLSELYCSSEFDNGGVSDGIVATNLTVGNTYYVRVYSTTETSGSFELCITSPDYEQGNITCEDVAPFCAPFDNNGDPEPLVFANGYFYLDTSPAQEGPDYGCLISQPNPAWFYLQVDQTGDLEFEIVQSTAFDGNSNPIGEGLDVDFIVYGPFSQLDDNCGDLDSANTVDCSYSGDAIEEMILPGAEAGEIYLVLITNFDQTPGYISLIQTNYGQSNGGTTDCTILEDTIYGCEGEDVTLVSQFSNQLAYVWYIFNETTEEFELIQPLEEEESYTVSDEGTYQVVSYDSAGVGTSENFTVLFSPSPIIDLGADDSLCGVSNITLDATPTNTVDFGPNIQYVWYQDDVEISGETNATYTLTEEGVYSVEVIGNILDENGNALANNTCMTTDEITISDANFTVNLGDDQVICNENSYIFEAAVVGESATNADYIWYDENGNVIPGATSATFEATYSGEFSVEVTINGCSNLDNVELLINDLPQIDLGSDVTTCDLTGAIIDATPLNMAASDVIYTWYLDGVELSGEASASLSPSDYGFGSYTVSVFLVNDPSGDCGVEQSLVYQEASSDLSIATSEGATVIDLPYCSDTDVVPSHTITFTASSEEGIPSGATYQWYLDGSAINGATASSYTVTYNAEGDYVEDYQIEVFYNNCSFVSDMTSVDVNIEAYENGCVISQGISPSNLDGMNDCLDLTFLNDRTGIESLKVYNRYGRLVFEQDNYVNNFCGQDKNGDQLASGTYYYVLVLSEEDPVFGKMKRSWIYVNQDK
ncbi:gliding motility-associated C-terminal domain-containing protein [Mesonia aestuariivivens]|uniref:Gliding motility-associated C-terminal domain-containing protein n=1 Tax=Mesonia aestuariivivens TaxID=2796128 RepID=A0ABS6VXI6_9FLAO|nr:gliding motility-associated C-terminal domain-containing protein [Mesonia aestuariivivens]MBW2960295.1 gliding motility-associated C-terminal domain-containing protein [Mesonia aestuariivivens]